MNNQTAYGQSDQQECNDGGDIETFLAERLHKVCEDIPPPSPATGQSTGSPSRPKGKLRRALDQAIRRCNNSKISNKNIGAYIRSFHFSVPIGMLLSVLYGPKWSALLGCVFTVVVFSLFINVKFCYLSLLEKKLCEDDINIVDPWIEMFNQKVSKKTRIAFTYKIGITYSLTMLILYYIRFLR